MRRFHARALPTEGGRFALDADESHHLRDVLRLRQFDEVLVFDGVGTEFLCRIASISKNAVELDTLMQVGPTVPESPIDITLAAALMKGDRTELCIQKAVELGINKFVPIVTERTEKMPRNTEKHLRRWQRIALDATKQSGRARLMSIEEPMMLSSFLSNAGPDILFFAERGGRPLPASLSSGHVTIIVGPEGGWSEREIELARSTPGSNVVTLGGRILRAETAAIAIAAIVQHKFGDLL